ncbi:MAG TPA: ribonuclease HIII [Candidatus Gastranaerophilales bacterium]|nr:ribonuclease HIII [Candidatus Gastranaerophilales bacterium]
MSNSFSLKIDLSKEGELKSRLEKSGFNFKQAEYTLWRAQKSEITVSLYKSGKLLVQGKNAENFVNKLLNNSVLSDNVQAQLKTVAKASSSLPQSYKSWIGTDESGKGDYFGPLVVAGVLVDENNLSKLSTLGVQDSKKLKDSFIEKIAPEIQKISVFSVIVINPAKYNELYKKIGNLNNLLAWGHARAIENILEKTPCQNALSDKFGNESLIKNALLKQGKTINLEQRTKAEDDIAVAAASVLARNEFVKRMKKISLEYGVNFPKGASEEVIKQAKIFTAKYGLEKLSNVAKLHFKTTLKI